MPLVGSVAGIDHELRIGDDHLECGDTPARCTREQVLDVVVRSSEPEEGVRRVQRLV